MTHHTNVRIGDKGKSPQLPAFCRTRRPITTTVRVSTLQQLLWLLWLVLALQLSTILLVIAGPVPPRLSPTPAPSRTLITAAARSIPVTLPPVR